MNSGIQELDRILLSEDSLSRYAILARNEFLVLRDELIKTFLAIEKHFLKFNANNSSQINSSDLFICNKRVSNGVAFDYKSWNLSANPNNGGGVISKLKGNVFEKLCINFSNVSDYLGKEFAGSIPGALENNLKFHAVGVSLISHMHSPHVPAAHMNIRFLRTAKHWFGGVSDITPIVKCDDDVSFFKNALKEVCDMHDSSCYKNFRKNCDEYFMLRHRNESRGSIGIFFDYLNNNNFLKDLEFVSNMCKAFLRSYKKIILDKMFIKWNMHDREEQLLKRGKYAEFNLLYDRGTQFGIYTNANPDAVLASMPPLAKWE